MALAGDHVQVLVDGYDLTGDHNKVNVEETRQTLEATTFGMSTQRFIPGQRKLVLAHDGFLNPDVAAAHPVLKGVTVDGVVSVLIGTNAAPAVGDPVYNLVTQQEMYQSQPEVGQVIPFSATFANRGKLGGWGTLLLPPTNLSDDLTGTGVDNGIQTDAGGAAFVQISTAAASDTYAIAIEGSNDDSAYSVLGTFDLDGSQVGSERLALTGTLPRYLRATLTRTGSAGDTMQAMVAIVRF